MNLAALASTGLETKELAAAGGVAKAFASACNFTKQTLYQITKV